MKIRLLPIICLALASACSKSGTVEGNGIYITRSTCPQLGIPAGTGDVTTFDPAGSTDARAIDVVATITNLRSTCDETGAQIISTASFDVVATRRDAAQARQVVLPFYNVVMQGGNRIVAKNVGAVALDFAAGSLRAQTSSRVVAQVDRASTGLPEDVRKELTRKRKTGDADAAIDPLSDPKIRDAVARATFEHLVGFQLSQDQLRYNATR
ncbi:hypothetical protein [Sphingomonas sp.]|uniref:hypothetical protein n=1 Tax=Sphingomonas sp. TaxID=28214 RepID=UPI00286B88A2|nr:hypothetical protein [Sphingomonas sp.]